MGTQENRPSGIRRRPGRRYLGLGVGLALLGPLLYAIQFHYRVLTVPWYIPVLGTVGAALLLAALVRARTVTRVAAVLVFGLLAGAEWHFLVWHMKLPAYAGPVVVGSPFPAFTTTQANGSAFDQDSLRGEQDTVLVFFRGRW